MNLYTGNPDTDDSCVAVDLENRYRMFLREGFTPAEAVREAKEIIKFEWLVDQGRDQDQAALLVQMPLRSMMMTTFSQKPADLGYPARIQWLLDRGLYTYEEATVLAFHSFDVLVVMHDEEEVAAGRQHRIQDYFPCNRHRRLRPASIHPLASVAGDGAKVAAVKPTIRESEVTKPMPAPLPFVTFSNLDRYLRAPEPKPEEQPPSAPDVPVESKPTINYTNPEPVVTKKAKLTPVAKPPTFKWSWKSSRANHLSTVASAFEQEEEAPATSVKPGMAEPKKNEPESKPDIQDIPKEFKYPPPPLPVPSPTAVPVVIPEVTPEPPPLPPEISKPPEPEPEPDIPKPPEPVFQISTITTGPTNPRPIPSLAAPKSADKRSSAAPPSLKWSSTIPTISTRGNSIVITPTQMRPPVPEILPEITPSPSESEFCASWNQAWGDGTSGRQGRWANFMLDQDVVEDLEDPYGVRRLNNLDDPYGVKISNRQPVETVERPASPKNKVDDLYAMLNRFQ